MLKTKKNKLYKSTRSIHISDTILQPKEYYFLSFYLIPFFLI